MCLPQLIRRTALAFLVLSAIWTSPALACTNDTSVTRSEEEFRSRYDALEPDTRAPSRFSIWGIGALSAGAGLVAGSVAVGLQRKKRGGR
jgi:hypothetical protein